MNTHIVSQDEAGRRLDVILTRASGAARSLAASAIKHGSVRLNGAPAKASTPVCAGDTIEYDVPTRTPIAAAAEHIDLHIVFEDDSLLVVDKPPGMVTHPARGAPSGTLVNALLGHFEQLPGDALRPGLVHRLDRDTSGLLVIAKTELALTALGNAMKARRITREYRGLVVGAPERKNGIVDGPIARDPHNRLRYTIRAEGKPAVTHYAMRTPLRGASELTFRLETGRTHQIRVHLRALGHPLVNDPIYGRVDPRCALPGQALHAWKLAFRHPTSGQEVQFEAQPPAAYLDMLAQLAIQAP